jgi:hypothetical protein
MDLGLVKAWNVPTEKFQLRWNRPARSKNDVDLVFMELEKPALKQRLRRKIPSCLALIQIIDRDERMLWLLRDDRIEDLFLTTRHHGQPMMMDLGVYISDSTTWRSLSFRNSTNIKSGQPSAPLRPFVTKTVSLDSISSDQTFQKLRSLIIHCEQKHSDFKLNTAPKLPKRLLDVNASIGGFAACLHISKPEERGRYVALSYC